MLKHAGSHIRALKLERVFANMFACARASVQARARMRLYLQLEQLDQGIDLFYERRLEVDL
jgi:hypothetical protein